MKLCIDWRDIMFIHIGNDHVIRSRKIISIVDISVITSSSIVEELISNKMKKNKVKGPRTNAKSVIIMKDIIYFSSLSVLTLKKRSSIINMINKFEDYSSEIKLGK